MIEQNKFRSTSLEVELCKYGISVSMEEYADAIKSIPAFRLENNSTLLNSKEITVFRSYVGKLM